MNQITARKFTTSQIARMGERLERRLCSDRLDGVWLDDRKVVVLRRPYGFTLLLVRDRGGDSYHFLSSHTVNTESAAAEQANSFLEG